MKKIILLSFFIIFSKTYSQEYNLGKTTIEELKETEHITDKNAAAAILFKIGKVSFDYNAEEGFFMNTNVMYKIKIYSKEGFDWANFQQKIYIGGNVKETVIFKNAVTYNLVDGKIEKTKLKSNGEFVEKLNKFWEVKKIVLPNVKEGSIVEFEYSIKSNSLSNIDKWNFQDEIPVNYSKFTTFIPEYFSYNVSQKGFLFPIVNKDSKSRKIDYTYTKNFEPGLSTTNTPTNRVNGSLQFNEFVTNYTLSNVPSLKQEAFTKNISNYISTIDHELESIKYPNETIKLFSTSWDEVAKNINFSDEFGGELNKKGYYEEQINKVVTGKSSSEEKLNAVYNFVKSNYKWNGYYGIYTDEGLKSIYKNKTGNVADINLSLIVFLRHVGLNAHPVLISSVSNGIPAFPSRTAFNYVVAGVELNGNTILLDATEKYALPNILPSRAINWIGRMIYQNGGSKEVDLEPTIASKNNIILNYSISPDGKVTGNLKRQLTSYYAFNYRNTFGQMAKESIVENKEKNFDNIEISNYTNENVNDLDLAVIESFDFVDDKHIEIIGDKIYLSPLLFFSLNSNPFKSVTRTFPIDFPFPSLDKYLITITIPDGYQIESVPQTENILFSDKILAHKYILTSDDKTIKLMLQDEVNTSILPAENYQNLKDYFQKIVDKQTEKIVLKKTL